MDAARLDPTHGLGCLKNHSQRRAIDIFLKNLGSVGFVSKGFDVIK